MTAMDLSIHTTSLPHTDPEASLAFCRDVRGFEVRKDVGSGEMRWITVGPPGQPGTSILLAPPAADPGITDDERRTIAGMMAKGTFGWDSCWPRRTSMAPSTGAGWWRRGRPRADGAVLGGPRRAFRDPAGNLVRIPELR
jgi:catechol 2,3-dioxygenase-like lactoylglutathione lyase family enzyme